MRMTRYRPIARLLAAILTVGSSWARAQPNDLGTAVRTPAGMVQGTARDADGVLAFKGIPYAAPPIGALRWYAPLTSQPWSGTRDATRFGNRCLSAMENDHEPAPAA